MSTLKVRFITGLTVTYQDRKDSIKQQTYMTLRLTFIDVLKLLFLKYKHITIAFEHDPKPTGTKSYVENFNDRPYRFTIKEQENK